MLDRLPSSVLHCILSHAVPSPHPRFISRRYKYLLLYSSLSRSISRVAQQLLYTHIDIEDDRSATRFIRAVDDCAKARRLAFDETRSVRLSYSKYALSSTNVSWVLWRTPGAKEICLENLKVDPLGLSVAASCQTLYLFNCELLETSPITVYGSKPAVLQPETWHFPRLTSLIFSCSYFVTHKRDWIPLTLLLNPVSLPALKSLAFTYNDQTSAPQFRWIAEQVTHLWLRRLPTTSPNNRQHNAEPRVSDLPKEDLAFCSAHLLHLAVDLHQHADFDALTVLGTHNEDAIVNPRPSSLASSRPESSSLLRSLRLESPYLTTAERALLSALPSLPCLDDLSHLILSDLSQLPPSSARATKEKASRETIRAECEARRITVVEALFHHPEKGYEAQKEDWRAWMRVCEWVDEEGDEDEEVPILMERSGR
ncbi:hypothetical protein JCM11251_002897 [Rhodosporidiobolus azoricus]